MRKFILVIFCLFCVSTRVSTQVDSQYIEIIPRNKTIQVHTTLKDLSVNLNHSNGTIPLFRNHNWSTGMYLKRGILEFFFALPLIAIDNSTLSEENTFGTGFGLNFYPNKIHLNYNFKLILGYKNLDDAFDKGFDILNTNNYFIFNRLNFHYVVNSEKWSLKSALRFNDRQLKSAGSFLIYSPVSYHNMRINELELDRAQNISFKNFHRIAAGAGVGYGYTYVLDNLNISGIAKAGLDARYTKWGNNEIDPNLSIFPSINIIASLVYDVGQYFIGVNYNYYPEYDYGNAYNITVENWKMRLYAGKRFY